MSHRFETVSDVFPEKNVTPFMVLDAASVEPQWFANLEELLQHVRKVDVPMWVDVTSGSAHERYKLLTELPFGVAINANTLETVMNPTENDMVELQPTTSLYVRGALTCMTSHHALKRDSSVFLANGDVESDQPRGSESETLCSFLITERVAVTLHTEPFLGLTESMWKLMHRTRDAVGNTPQPYFTSTVLATLVAFTSESMLPDPTALLHEVNYIDEMVVLINPGDHDRSDMLRRIAMLRRRISVFRSRLYLRELVLQELMSPMMHSCFVCGKDELVHKIYTETAEKVTLVSERLDETRTMLNQSNLNFVTGVSMRMTQSSCQLDYRMQLIGQMTTVCLPLQFLLGVLGVNQTIPYQVDHYDSLAPFYWVLFIMAIWSLFASIPTMLSYYHGNYAKSILPLKLLVKQSQGALEMNEKKKNGKKKH